MGVRFSISLPDGLNRELEEVAGADDEAKIDALRKAIRLYIEARKAVRGGQRIGIADSKTTLVTEFIGL